MNCGACAVGNVLHGQLAPWELVAQIVSRGHDQDDNRVCIYLYMRSRAAPIRLVGIVEIVGLWGLCDGWV